MNTQHGTCRSPRCAESISLRHAIVIMQSQSSDDDLLGFSTRFGVLGHTMLNLTVFEGRFSMEAKDMRRGRLCRFVMSTTVAVSFGALFAAIPAVAQDSKGDRDRFFFWPGNLVVSRSVYDNNPNNVKVGEILPPNCASTQAAAPATGAPYNGTYPYVLNNDLRRQLRHHVEDLSGPDVPLSAFVINSLKFRTARSAEYHGSDQLVTSFSSKSELALNLSTDRST